MEKKKFKTVNEYLDSLDAEKKEAAQKLRKLIKDAAPHAEEVISYNMPAYKQNGILVYFAVHANHIGFYPTRSGVKVFKNKLKDYETSEGTIQFPFEKGIPASLVKEIVKFRVTENLEKMAMKRKKHPQKIA